MFGVALPAARRARNRAAFTLTELLVVLAILGALVGLKFSLIGIGQDFADDLSAQVEKARNPKGSPKVITTQSAMVADQYIIMFKPSVGSAKVEAERLATTFNAQIVHVYDAGSFKGFAAKIPPAAVA